jgi:hypothetical protein
MRRQIPLTVVLVFGIGMMIQFFVPSAISTEIYQRILRSLIIIASFAMVLAVGSLINHHWLKIKRAKGVAWYSWVTLAGLVVMALLGTLGRIPSLSGLYVWFRKLFLYVQAPMDSSMFAILAFYMASASYRAFRARTMEATVLLLAAFVVMLGVVPFGAHIWDKIPGISEWLMMYPNMASKRGIMFGVGLGIAATSLKIILGIERGWLGGGGK